MRALARWLRYHGCRMRPLMREGPLLVCRVARYQRVEALAMERLPYEEGDGLPFEEGAQGDLGLKA